MLTRQNSNCCIKLTIPHLSFVKAIRKTFLKNFDQIKKVFPKSYISQLVSLDLFLKSNKILKCIILAHLVQNRPQRPKRTIMFHSLPRFVPMH